MTDDDRDLLAGEALGALSSDDAARVAELVARDGVAAAELQAHRATVAAIDAGVARELPSADLFDRILAEIEPATAAVRRRRTWRWSPRVATAGLAAAAVVVLGFVVLADGRGDPDARAAIAGTAEFTGVTGEAALYGNELVLDLRNVPPPPSGHHYEVWVLRTEANGAMEAVGAFTPEDEDASLEFRLPGPGDYRAVDVSVEPDGGPAEHSDVSLAGGSFES